MTTYQVTAWCSVNYYATFDVEAGSMAEALEKARGRAREEPGEPCDGAECDWNEFEIISDGNEDERFRHLEPELLAANTATELLEELQRGVALAQGLLETWERGDLAASVRSIGEWLTDARTILRWATTVDPSV